MSVITYTAHARAPLISGHTAGTSYSFDIKFRTYDRTINSPKTQHRALDNTIETVLKDVNQDLSVVIGAYGDSEQAQIDEFIYSVAGGEQFTIDLNGTAATPDAPVSVKYTGKVASEQRVGVNKFIMQLPLVKL